MAKYFCSARAWPAPLFNLFCIGILTGVIACAQFAVTYLAYSDSRLSIWDNMKRMRLVERTIDNPEFLSEMGQGDITILLQTPSLKRTEQSVIAWHYHGGSCALDIYFSNHSEFPDYIEYRTLSMNDHVQERFETIDEKRVNRYCLQDVMQAQGLSTPESYAGAPLPSWDSPYRS